jgi:serine phosphatase RsbU (regulator of sigma subunit)
VFLTKSDPARVFVGLDEGMMSIYRLGGGWIKEGKIKDFKANVFKMSEKENGIIWMGTINQGLYKMTVKESGKKFTTEIARYDTSSGLPSGAIYPQLTTQGVIFGTGEGIFSMNGEGKFSPVREIMQLFPEGKRGIHRIKEDYKGRIWMITYLGNTFETGYLEKNGEVYQWTSTPFKPISKSIVHAILHESGFVTWLGGADGVSRFEGYKDKNYRPQYNTQIRKVVLGEDSILYWGSYRNENGSLGLVQPEIFKQVLPYSLNSVTFEFAAQMYENESQKQYSYYLEGFDKEWSMWKIETKAVYTNLPEGDYRFRVKSVNIYGNESTEAVYEFTILPPWSRTMWAYAGYLILFIAFVYGAVNLSTRRLQAIIRERTQEIVHQKEEIEKQKEVVEEKQKEIIDSINYAKRIQSAILAREEDIKQIYPDSFLLYKPKDIVAGDFYFFETTPTHVFYAAADCTGHGVPGALVSVVCSNALNRCVKEFGLTDPGQILDKTRELVVETFKKSGQEVKDGMDISLLVKELEKNIYSWAGANNPLWLIQTNPENNEVELLEIKANKQPIGLSEKPAPFTSHNLLLRKGDAVCLFTDGYADQFGGPEGKKFKYKPFKELLKNVYKISSSEQKVVLDTTIEEWKKGFEQIDDICVIGIRV